MPKPKAVNKIPNIDDLAAERDRLRENLSELKKVLDDSAVERNGLRAEVAELRKVVAESQKAIHFLSQREFAFTQQDLAEFEKDGVTFEDVIRPVEQAIRGIANA